MCALNRERAKEIRPKGSYSSRINRWTVSPAPCPFIIYTPEKGKERGTKKVEASYVCRAHETEEVGGGRLPLDVEW